MDVDKEEFEVTTEEENLRPQGPLNQEVRTREGVHVKGFL